MKKLKWFYKTILGWMRQLACLDEFWWFATIEDGKSYFWCGAPQNKPKTKHTQMCRKEIIESKRFDYA